MIYYAQIYYVVSCAQVLVGHRLELNLMGALTVATAYKHTVQ
jgi:hypothetical protein